MPKQQVRVLGVPDDRARFIKALRLVGPLRLKQAADLALYLDRFRGSVLVAGVDADVAQHISEVLQAAGAKVVVEPSSVCNPMLCCPETNGKREWSAFRMIRSSAPAARARGDGA